MARTFFGLIKLLRYRFLLIAGLFPYGLGTAIAFYSTKSFDLHRFLAGLGITLLALIGVEAFNEYFDWQNGSDRVFQESPRPVTKRTLVLGIVSFSIAFLITLFLSFQLGYPVIILYLIGFLAAFFYLAPPIKLSYRGLGEIDIALSYGPLLVLASYYVQTGKLALLPLGVSVIPALLLFKIAILNQVPDYFQDRLVGKRNFCVRIGRENLMKLYGIITIIFYGIILTGLYFKQIPQLVWSVPLIAFPLSLTTYLIGNKTYSEPERFLPAIRYMVINYLLISCLLIASYLF